METISLKNSAFVSVDNTRTFDDKTLKELYVPEWEIAAYVSQKIARICHVYGILTVNVFDKHPKGHISFASSYKNKQPFDSITLEEVKDRTEEQNGLSKKAAFTVEQLQNYLKRMPGNIEKVWPEHGKDWTESIDLMRPLAPDDFDLHIVKWEKVDSHPYGWFGETTLDRELKKREIKTLFIGGVATDYCSGITAEEGIDLWYDVYLVTDAVRGIAKETTDQMLEILKDKGVKFIHSGEFDELVQKSFIF